MRTLIGMVFLLLVCLAVVGFYQGWFHFSTESTGDVSSATVTVDQNKIRADETKAKEKVEELTQKAK